MAPASSASSGNTASAPEEIGAQRKQDDATPLGIPSRLDERVDERVPFLVVAADREDLLELVDRDDQALPHPQIRDRSRKSTGHAPGELRGRP